MVDQFDSSQLFYDEEFSLESENLLPDPLFVWSKNEKRGKVDLLIIALEGPGSYFAQTLLGPKPILCGVILFPDSSFTGEYQTSISPDLTKKKFSLLYSLDEKRNESVYILLIQPEINIERVNSFSSLLFENVVPERIVIFGDLPSHRFKTPPSKHIKLPSLRRLSNKINGEIETLNQLVILESPNFVEGTSASFLTLSLVHHIPTELFVCITDSHTSLISQIETFSPTLPYLSSLSNNEIFKEITQTLSQKEQRDKILNDITKKSQHIINPLFL